MLVPSSCGRPARAARRRGGPAGRRRSALPSAAAAPLSGRRFPRCAHAVEPALLDEGDDRVQLAGVEERAVAAADVHDRAGQPAEVHAVHHLAAPDARPVAHGSGGRGLRGRWSTGAAPRPATSRSAQMRSNASASSHTPSHRGHSSSDAVADRDLLQRAAARRTARAGGLGLRARTPRPALRAERRPFEHQGKAAGTADRGQPRPAVRAPPGVRIRRGAAIGTMKGGGVHWGLE